MRPRSLALSIALFALAAAPAIAQEQSVLRPVHREANVPEISMADVTPTPEMWIYSQERKRYEDPWTAVRRKAERRAEQRQRRIASMKAFGLSKQRPLVHYTPFHTYFSVWNNYGWLTITPTYSIDLPPGGTLWR